MSRHNIILFLLITIVFSSRLLQAQPLARYNSFSFNVNEGLLQSTIIDLAFDKNNFCWLSFPNGIQKFDGKNFTTVPVQPGLPDDKLTYFFQCRNDDLLISHAQGISKYKINSNKFIEVYKSLSADKNPAQFLGEVDKVVYFYSSNGTITGIDCSSYNIVSEIKTGFPNYASNGNYHPKISDNIINHRVVLLINSTLYLWDLKTKKLLSRSPVIAGISPFFLKMKNENEVLYNDNEVINTFQVYNFTTHKITGFSVKGKDDKPLGRCHIFYWQNKILLSFDSKLYETDSTFQILKSELVNFQNGPVAGAHSIAGLKQDNFGNLYLQTVRGGIKKIIKNNYPFKYYSAGKQEDNFAISILPDKKNNRILVGTSGNGLLVFDTLQNLIKHISTLPGQKQAFSPNTIIKKNNGNYMLFNLGEKQVWELDNKLSVIKHIPISSTLPENKSGILYFGNFLYQNDREAVIQSEGKLYRTTFTNNTVKEHEITRFYTMSGLLYNDIIITHANDELIYLDTANFKELKRIPFKNTGGVRCFANPAPTTHGEVENDIYIGSNKGIFKIDPGGKILQHFSKKSGLADECIYAMAFDEEGFLWCSTNKGIIKINKDKSIQQLKKEDGLQENEFNTNAVARAEDGELFFGGVNGINSFYPAAIKSFEEKINLFFTKIKVNNEDFTKDIAVWEIDKMNLSYNQNALAFDCIAMGSSNPGQYIYQYRMSGVDKEWIQSNELQTVRYYLQPGHYVLQVYASRVFDKEAKPLKEIDIIIQPPFWKTWWFLAIAISLFAGLLAILINEKNKKVFQQKLQSLENEKQLQGERERISKDLHDNLGAYANAVLFNTEQLEKEKEDHKKKLLIDDLKFASKDIITSLRETVWALKKETYSAEDCIVRVRNFIHPLSRYYSHINFKIDGEIPATLNLHYSMALNLVRIVQEAISNSIKHSKAKHISVTSYDLPEGWKLVIADDGMGFNFNNKIEAEEGNGLYNMHHRANESGFAMTIKTADKEGTLITLKL